MLTVWMILSVIASLLSLAALGIPPFANGLFIFAIFCSVSLLSLKNFSMLSLSLIILSVIIVLLSVLASPPHFSVMAEEADP